MKESVVFRGFESFDTVFIDNSKNVLDPEINFTEFLEEARKFANEKKQRQKEEESSSKKQVTNEEKKCKKKSWKKALISFWKTSSSSFNKQHSKEISKASNNPKPRGHFSGPVGGAVAGTGSGPLHRLATSGPLAGVAQHQKLKKKKGKRDEIAYVSLEKLNEPVYDAKTYGPVYLVS
ncbi:Glucose-6-phosphate isomerase [Bienertia sinuspersici]